MADKNYEKKREKERNEAILERGRSSSTSVNEHRQTSRRKTEKRKSRKRSHSESSDTDSSSSSSRSDSEGRKKRKKSHRKRSSSSSSFSSDSDDKHSKSKHKKKKRNSKRHSSSSSSSETDEKHSKSKHKQKKKKKLKKKIKSKKDKKKAKCQGVVDQNKYGAYGIIRESDMFVKQQEFYCWLQEVKNISAETLPKFETRKMFEDYMEDYNTATLPHKKFYDLEKWEAKRQKKNELKAMKKANEKLFSIADDEKRHEMLHRRMDTNKYAGPSRQQLLEMQQELRRRQDEEYKKKAGLA